MTNSKLAIVGRIYNAERWSNNNRGTYFCTSSEPEFARGINGSGMTMTWNQCDPEVYECDSFGRKLSDK